MIVYKFYNNIAHFTILIGQIFYVLKHWEEITNTQKKWKTENVMFDCKISCCFLCVYVVENCRQYYNKVLCAIEQLNKQQLTITLLELLNE